MAIMERKESMDAVIHFTPVKNTMQASAKIAKFIAEQLHCEIFDRTMPTSGNYDRFFLVNSPSAFCPFLKDLVKWAGKEMIWVMNDYTIYPPTQLRKTGIKMDCWGTLRCNPYPSRLTYANLRNFRYINWNALSWDPMTTRETKYPGLMYFGSFREGRRDLFHKYFLAAPYPVHISCSKRVSIKFEKATDFCAEMHPIFQNLIWDIAKFQATIYMEDQFSRKIFTSPPNRFYEAASSGIAVLIDSKCVMNLKEAGIEIKDRWIVSSQTEVKKCLEQSDIIRSEQKKVWTNDFRKRMEIQFKELL